MPAMYLVIRLLLVCFPLTLAAQQPLQYTRLTAENGLSNNSVRCILQDKSGIVWIGTHGGLNRYDGASFLQYSNLSTPALTNSVITALLQDAAGYLWIGTENGLNILHPVTNTLQQFVHDNGQATSLPAGIIRAIQTMPDNSIWVVSDRWVASFKDRRSFYLVSIDSSLLQEDMVLASVAAAGRDEVWISYLDQVTTLARKTSANGRETIRQAVYRAPDYAQVYVDANQVTWGISCHGINRFDAANRRFEPWLKNSYAPNSPNLHVYACYSIDAEGNVWQGSDRTSLVKYDMRQRQVTDFSWLLASTNATIAYCIYKDISNNIWVGTDNGIIKISNRTSIFNNIPFALHGIDLKNIRCRRIMADKDNTLYAATENYGLLKRKRLPGGRDTTIALSTFGATPVSVLPFQQQTERILLNGQYDIGYIYDMWYDGKDIIWLAGFGIGRYNIRTDSLQLFLSAGDEQARRASINQLAICFDGRLFWTAGLYNLYTFDPHTAQMIPFRDNKGNMPFDNLPCWSLVQKGNWIWAGTNKGLYKINILTREVVRLRVHPVLEFGVNDICLDADSSCWLSTMGGGIVHYNERTGAVQQYTSKDGLNNNTVCGMLRDNDNNLWISTYAGLSYFDQQTKQFTRFYAKDGLNTDEFNRKALTRLADGRMIFGGLNGYTVFDPATAFKRDKPVNILLTRFSKTTGDGRVVEQVLDAAALQQVVINPGDKFFAFHFTLTDMYDPANNRYRYMLQGLDNAWYPIGNQNVVSFNGLPVGTYTLRIKGSPGKGAESASEVVVHLIVKQVFYKTVWFMLLVLAVGAVIVAGILQYRINQVKKIQYLRTRIASDLHDEVGSSLVHITMLADMVKRGGDKRSMDEQLSGIAGISRGAVATMKDIIWSIDARYDTMEGMISHMRDHVHRVLASAEIEFEFVQQGLHDQEKLPSDFRQQVYLIFKEAINNVVKHSEATQVRISLQREMGLFVMEIQDNGKGIDLAHQSSGQGVSNMKMRAARLKATIEIITRNGVLVRLKAPV
jgi:ligand-binding sensor domain-containing protein/two-component sensor histidine kinase